MPAPYEASLVRFQDLPSISVALYGAIGDGATDDTAAIQRTIDAATASSGPSGRVTLDEARTYRIEGTLSVARRVVLDLGSSELRRSSSTLGPVVRLAKNSARLVGGRVASDVALTDGIVHLGPSTTGAVEWCQIDGTDIEGPGAAVAGSVGLKVAGATTFQNVVDGVIVHDVETGVLNEIGANANEFSHVQQWNIGLRPWHMKASQWLIEGGFVHSSSGVTVLTMEGCFKGYASGLRAEPGGASVGYSIDAGCNRCVLVVGMNTATVGTNAGTETLIVDKADIRAKTFTADPKPNVTGSRGGNAALASLLTSLASLGLITDGSSA